MTTRLAPLLLAALSLAAAETARAETAGLGIAPLEADLVAMRRTLAALEEALASRRPEAVAPLLAADLPEPAREAALDAAGARVRSLPPEADYSLRTDVGPGAVVPIGPERVQLQVTGTVHLGGGGTEPGAVYLELGAEEQAGRRRWALRALRFAGIASGPTPTGAAATIVAGVAAGVLLVGLALLALRSRARRRARRRAPCPGGGGGEHSRS